MVHKVILPRIDPSMDSGTIVEWVKREGEFVAKGEIIASIETLKAIVDIEAPAAGVLRKIFFLEGSTVPINQVIAIIGTPDEEIPEYEVARPEADRVRASPAAKTLAKEHGIVLTNMSGTGPAGRIVREDILNALKKAEEPKTILSTTPSERVAETIAVTATRRTIAERMTYSHRTIPQAVLMVKVDVSKMQQALQKAEHKVSYTAGLVKVVAEALRENKIMNSTLEGDEIKLLRDVNVGIAVATAKGLVVPVVHNATSKSVVEVATLLKELGEKGRRGTLSLSEVVGGTFTITNLGMFEVDTFIPIINPGQAGILGIGVIKDEPQVVDKQVVIRPTVTLTLTFDHRIVDGAPAAQFLARIKMLIEDPRQILSSEPET